MTSPVIVVGAGPVGLGAALELSRFGVRSVVLEQHQGATRHPKTRIISARTVEIARGWGTSVPVAADRRPSVALAIGVAVSLRDAMLTRLPAPASRLIDRLARSRDLANDD